MTAVILCRCAWIPSLKASCDYWAYMSTSIFPVEFNPSALRCDKWIIATATKILIFKWNLTANKSISASFHAYFLVQVSLSSTSPPIGQLIAGLSYEGVQLFDSLGARLARKTLGVTATDSCAQASMDLGQSLTGNRTLVTESRITFLRGFSGFREEDLGYTWG